ncbi:hypothetical protein [Sorangium cellulosum]|uniref:hypothetical protein n=1 Tax=Sorangium cellulosum TaxID=56 RepID=UPI001F3C2AFD|nr:hypothetical protein [Sorangium cellulosum]
MVFCLAVGLSTTACLEGLPGGFGDAGTGGSGASGATGSGSGSGQSSGSSAGEGGGTTTAGTGGDSTTSAGGEGGGTGGEGGGTTTAGTGGGGEGGGTTTAGTGGGEGGGTTTAGTGGEGGGAPPGDPACGPDTAAFADVEPILTRRCANEYCHGSPDAPSAGLDLRASMAVGELVNQGSVACSGERALVVPFMPSSSYLINKLKNVDLCGSGESSMPPGTPLPEAEIKAITDWICAGAPVN